MSGAKRWLDEACSLWVGASFDRHVYFRGQKYYRVEAFRDVAFASAYSPYASNEPHCAASLEFHQIGGGRVACSCL